MSTMTTEAHEVMAAQGVNYGDTTVEDLFDVPPEVDESAPTIVCVRITNVRSVVVANILTVPAASDQLKRRLLSFRSLQAGWAGEGSVTLNDEPLMGLVDNISLLACEFLQPSIFPTPAGGVEMEWTWGDRSALLEDPLVPNEPATFFAFFADDNRDEEHHIDLRTEEGSANLNRLLTTCCSTG